MMRVVRRSIEYGVTILMGFHVRYVIVFGIAHLFPPFRAGTLIARLYRLAGFSIGTRSSFAGPLRVLSGGAFTGRLLIGDDVLISSDVTINVDDTVRIGDRVSIGPFVRIYTASHPIGPGSRRMMWQVAPKPVTIEPGVWIGLGATILPGVVLGHGSVVAAGSVVTSDVPADVYVQGNPAVVVRSLPWGDR